MSASDWHVARGMADRHEVRVDHAEPCVEGDQLEADLHVVGPAPAVAQRRARAVPILRTAMLIASDCEVGLRIGFCQYTRREQHNNSNTGMERRGASARAAIGPSFSRRVIRRGPVLTVTSPLRI